MLIELWSRCTFRNIDLDRWLLICAHCNVTCSGTEIATVVVQNDAEKAGMIEAHLRDAVALCEHFSWFEEQMEAGKEITECASLRDVGLASCRSSQMRVSIAVHWAHCIAC